MQAVFDSPGKAARCHAPQSELRTLEDAGDEVAPATRSCSIPAADGKLTGQDMLLERFETSTPSITAVTSSTQAATDQAQISERAKAGPFAELRSAASDRWGIHRTLARIRPMYRTPSTQRLRRAGISDGQTVPARQRSPGTATRGTRSPDVYPEVISDDAAEIGASEFWCLEQHADASGNTDCASETDSSTHAGCAWRCTHSPVRVAVASTPFTAKVARAAAGGAS